jgi:hypothetical protein
MRRDCKPTTARRDKGRDGECRPCGSEESSAYHCAMGADDASIRKATDFIRQWLGKLGTLSYGSRRRPATSWAILRDRDEILEAICRLSNELKQKKERAYFMIIAVRGFPDLYAKDLRGRGFEGVACVGLEMPEDEAQELLKEVQAGKHSVLVADPYRFDSKWDLGRLESVAEVPVKRGDRGEGYVVLFLVNPVSMTTLQIERAGKAGESWARHITQHITNTPAEYEEVAIVSIDEGNKNVALRRIARQQGGWSADLVREYWWLATCENDKRELARKIDLMSHQTDPLAAMTLLGSAVLHLESILDPEAL